MWYHLQAWLLDCLVVGGCSTAAKGGCSTAQRLPWVWLSSMQDSKSTSLMTCFHGVLCCCCRNTINVKK